MAGRKQKPVHDRLELATDPNELSAQLQEQIERGKRLLASMESGEGEVSELLEEYNQWHDFNRTLLNVSFSSREIAVEYVNSAQLRMRPTFGGDQDRIVAVRENLPSRLSKLKSIKEQIPVIPQSSDIRTDKPTEMGMTSAKRSVFVVHGHDEAAKLSVARFVEQLDFDTILLQDRPNRGSTLIEKLEQNSSVGFAVVLITPDDVVASKAQRDDEQNRARQNVIFELGYFMGKLGRGKVCVLKKGDIEFPSDLVGTVYIEMDEYQGWQKRLAVEIDQSGMKVDWTKFASI